MSRAEPQTGALLALIERFAGLRVWVLGDLMLDQYVVGAVERISPEAPVPVVRAQGAEQRPGGAANVARQLAALGARVRLAGIVGADEAGEQLLGLCRAAHIDTAAVERVAGRQTTRKLRVLGHDQQLLRIDWEDVEACTPQLSERLVRQLLAGEPPDAIILSDYAKGVVTPEAIAAIARARGTAPVVVDPKHRDFTRYRGAATLTPNLHELAAAAGCTLDAADNAAIAAAARAVLKSAGLPSMVVTLGNRGMLVVPAHGAEVAVPAQRHEVYDVTGAGDTAIAVLALGLAAHAPLLQAAQLANAAAGVAVCQVGTAAVSAAGIRDAAAARPTGKLLSRHELAERCALWRAAGKRIVLTNGCFDLLHAGHLALLHHAAGLGEVLVLAINSDSSVRRLKGAQRPLVPESERAALLAALTCVDAVTIFEEDTPLEVVQAVRPHVLVKGGDYRPEDVIGRELVEAAGGRVEIVPLTPDRSTSSLLERIHRSGITPRAAAHRKAR
jgi:D-beta-D-heptose 7-phosphate kinase/D-beta-D-heptose 1-phosphate adenosyltransferase